jgi:flagellar hook-associated protein 1 FlgK
LTDVTGGIVVDDPAAALNSTAAGLEFAPVNGSFVVHLKQKGTGPTSSTLIQVDLDGLNGDDTTLNALAAALDGIDGLSATVTGGQLRIATDGAGGEFSFSQDSSGVLAALGINVFFTGTGAQDIGVNAAVKARPGLLAAAGNGQVGDNATARTIADLASRPLASLEGISLEEAYERMINQTAVSASGARTSATAAASVRETLLSQREALSGVSLDEEAINLIREQRAFQAAARLIAAVDEMMRTLIGLV